MARRRQDRWLLIRLAAQNVERRRLRAILLAVAVMLASVWGLPDLSPAGHCLMGSLLAPRGWVPICSSSHATPWST